MLVAAGYALPNNCPGVGDGFKKGMDTRGTRESAGRALI